MKTIIIFLSMLISCNKTESQPYQVAFIDNNIYMYEYAIKKPNQINVGFIVMDNDLIVEDIVFTINFSKGKVKNVFRKNNSIKNNIQYLKKGDNILIEPSKLLCYDSKNFMNREKLIPDSSYEMISSSFLEITNKERLEILNKLSI